MLIYELTPEIIEEIGGKPVSEITKDRIDYVKNNCGKGCPCKCTEILKKTNMIYYFEGICNGAKSEKEKAYLQEQYRIQQSAASAQTGISL